MVVFLEQCYKCLKEQQERLKYYCSSSPLANITLKDVFLLPESKQNIHTMLFNYHIAISGYV
jgi:hypothetical protein